MKILSNFDTQQSKKLYREYVEFFGEDNVLVVHKSRLVWYAEIVFPVLFFIMLLSVGMYILYIESFGLNSIVYTLFWIIILWWALLLWIKLSARYIDFTMDFLLITPKEVMKYDQHGVFSKTAQKISADKIKSITFNKKWFLASFFDIWSLVFLAEWEHGGGDIEFPHVDAIESTQRTIRNILGQYTPHV